MNLLGSIFVAFGYETSVLKGARPCLRDTIAVGGAHRARTPASTAPLEIEVQRLQNGFGRDRALAPLESPQGVVRAVEGDALPADCFVQRMRRIGRGLHVRSVAEDRGVIAHPVLHNVADRSG